SMRFDTFEVPFGIYSIRLGRIESNYSLIRLDLGA
ncbi:unnamed protein product, partial [Rotaria magnacalcarata]